MRRQHNFNWEEFISKIAALILGFILGYVVWGGR